MPLSIPGLPWQYISMDYLTRYPTNKHQHDAILVVVNIFSNMAIPMPCKKTTTTQQTAQFFFEHVWKHYVLLTTIISDRDAKISVELSGNSLTQYFVYRNPSIRI